MKNKFSLRLKELRNEKSLSQQKLAETLGFTRFNIGDWEREQSEPDIETILLLAKFFDVSTDYLLGYSDDYN